MVNVQIVIEAKFEVDSCIHCGLFAFHLSPQLEVIPPRLRLSHLGNLAIGELLPYLIRQTVYLNPLCLSYRSVNTLEDVTLFLELDLRLLEP